jgi:hypothetical protein
MGSTDMAAAPEAKAVRSTGRPAGIKVMADGQTLPLDKASMRLVMQGWQRKLEMEAAKARLEEVNAALLEAHGGGCKLRVVGIATATLSARSTVKVSDPERLREVLGERWDDLVAERVSYSAYDRLVELSVDGDEPLAPAIRQCLTIADSTAVTWRSDS